jgi:hypothetical protein
MRARNLLLNDDLERRLRAELWQLERGLSEASLAEALRLLGSPRFAEVTEQHVREVSEYRPIEIAGERFFERAFSRSKEAGATLGFARLLGANNVRADLERLRASIRGSEKPAGASPLQGKVAR